jgi:hypothetical protein
MEKKLDIFILKIAAVDANKECSLELSFFKNLWNAFG